MEREGWGGQKVWSGGWAVVLPEETKQDQQPGIGDQSQRLESLMGLCGGAWRNAEESGGKAIPEVWFASTCESLNAQRQARMCLH